MIEAKYYKQFNNHVQCHLCPHFCVIKNNELGKCKARKNINNKLYSLNYGKSCSMAIDPIEKKPLFHFMPGTKTLSVSALGCNMQCIWCQNWQISQSNDTNTYELSPQKVVDTAISNDCKSISYTYTEPTVFYEYVLDTAKLAKKNNLKNITVSNGYINKKPLEELYSYIDAANIDLKSFSESFYKKYCNASLKPVLETLINIKNLGIHLEVTTLLIPGLNDSSSELKNLCKWFVNNLGKETPLHFTRFFPMYKAKHLPPTDIIRLKEAENIAKSFGIKNVHLGNI
ncbi:AmmeMemoRadiSam system radical SAM enzyme [Candidatus Woesearchaeota archaeon]|nr:MAG: AmmeMemoRadiSam system radical SAM enzyme [Candidatus Woesearchaeota archaeon]